MEQTVLDRLIQMGCKVSLEQLIPVLNGYGVELDKLSDSDYLKIAESLQSSSAPLAAKKRGKKDVATELVTPVQLGEFSQAQGVNLEFTPEAINLSPEALERAVELGKLAARKDLQGVLEAQYKGYAQGVDEILSGGGEMFRTFRSQTLGRLGLA